MSEGIGHNSDNFDEDDGDDILPSDEQLRLFVERIERLNDEIKDIQDDRKDVYLELKSQGYDPAIVRKVVALRKMNPQDRKEQEAVLDVYKSALGIL